MDISRIVKDIKSIDAFQFSGIVGHINQMERLGRVLDEYIGQIGLYCRFDVDSSRGELMHKLEISSAEDFDYPRLWVNHAVAGRDAIGLLADYTAVWLRRDQVIIDLCDQSSRWGYGNGGYFATQPGIAFGRTMAHGFQPMNVAPEDIPDTQSPDCELREVKKVTIYANGAISYAPLDGQDGEEVTFCIGVDE